MKTHYDITIIGAGMVGLVCAHLLKDSGLSIAVIESNSINVTWPIEGYDSRVSALNKNSKKLLDDIDCWQRIQAMRVGVYDKMNIWEQQADYQLDFNAAELADDYLGYIVENSVIRKALLDSMPDNIDMLCPIKLTAIKEQTLIVHDGAPITSDLIIGADGSNSWTRTQCGIESKQYGYKQHAIVATVKSQQSHQQTAYQVFLPTGPLAFLPLDNVNYSSIVWSVDDDYAKQLLALQKENFDAELTKSIGNKLGNSCVVSELKSFPLYMRHANDYVKSGMALIGDAVRSIHPLAGQGVNLGFKDAQVLADTILVAQKKQQKISSLHTLKKYQRARKSQSIAMIIAMEFFKQVFSTSTQHVKRLREKTIQTINKQQLLKQFFSKVASGAEIF